MKDPHDGNSVITMKEEKVINQDYEKKNLVPTGAGIAAICFFLPWIKFSCGSSVKRSVSGSDLGGIFWVVLIAALVVLVSFYFFKSSGKLKDSKPIVLLGSAIPLAIILFKYVELLNGLKTEFGVIKPEDIGLTFQYGAYGTLVGFVLSLIGSSHLDD